MQKTKGDIQQALATTSANGLSGSVRESDLGSAVIHEDGTLVRPSADDQASTRGIMAPSSPTSITEADVNDNEPISAVPTIRISTESSRENDSKEEEERGRKKSADNNDDSEDEEKAEPEESESELPSKVDRKKEKGKAKEVYVDNGQEKVEDSTFANGTVQHNGIQKHDLERPIQAAGEGDQNVNEVSSVPAQEPFSFSNKRLCERWLDNLFMVLYEVG